MGLSLRKVYFWNATGKKANILEDYDRNLAKNSYSLTWEKLTAKEKSVIFALVKTSSQKEVCPLLNMSNGNLQTYKRGLLDKGLNFERLMETTS